MPVPQSQRQEPQAPANLFDLKVQYFDGRGRLRRKNPYRLHVQNGIKYFERPVNSGNLFHENNEPAGRVEWIENAKKELVKSFDFKAAHKAYTAPLEGAEKLHFDFIHEQEKNAALLAELEAIKAEKAALEAQMSTKAPAAKSGSSPLAAAQPKSEVK